MEAPRGIEPRYTDLQRGWKPPKAFRDQDLARTGSDAACDVPRCMSRWVAPRRHVGRRRARRPSRPKFPAGRHREVDGALR